MSETVYDRLQSNIKELTAFIGTETFQNLTQAQRDMLELQHSIMCELRDNYRLSTATPTNGLRPPSPYVQDYEEIREVGNADIDRDGPPDFAS